MGDALQLGKTFSSNDSGDGPNEDGISGKCLRCFKAVPTGRRACDECYEAGIDFPKTACAVCDIRTEVRYRRTYNESEAK